MKKYILNESNKKYILKEAVETKNWTELLKQAAVDPDQSKFDELFDRYLEEYWGKENGAIIVQKLGQAFTQEVTNFGYTEEENPFIKFLRSNNCERLHWFNDSNSRYIYLHNAAANGYINEEDLKSGGNFGNEHLIFIREAYSLPEKIFRLFLEIINKFKRQERKFEDQRKDYRRILFDDSGRLRTKEEDIRREEKAVFGENSVVKSNVSKDYIYDKYISKDLSKDLLFQLVLNRLGLDVDADAEEEALLTYTIGTIPTIHESPTAKKAWKKAWNEVKFKDKKLIKGLANDVYLAHHDEKAPNDAELEEKVNAFFNKLT